jgi:uncharacterized protein YcgI (DUF1989 family)
MDISEFYARAENAQPHGTNPTLTSPISPDGVPALGRRYIVPGRQGRAVLVKRGQTIRIGNPLGQQVCDAWAFAAGNASEYLSWPHARAAINKATPAAGDVLVTNRRRPILTLLEDTSPGVHDTLIAACDIFRYRGLDVEAYHDNCSDNLRMAMMAIGQAIADIPQPFNIWMNTPLDRSGAISWLSPVSKPGDHVVMRAEMDAFVVMSACPQDLIPINGANMIPSELDFAVNG